MRIAMVSETYPPEVNGVARTVARFTAGLRKAGHAVTLVRPRQNGDDRATRGELLVPGIPIPRYPQLRMGWPAGSSLARRWLEERPDVVHISTEGPLGWSALRAARKRSVPVATSYHTNFDAYSAHYGAAPLAGVVRSYLRRFHNLAQCTMVPTASLAAELGAFGFAGVQVLGRGVDSAVFSPEQRSRALRASWGADDQTMVALCVSRFAPEKNLPLVIAAYRAMTDARPGTKLVLAGDDRPLARDLRALGFASVISERLPEEALSAHYASADVFLFPSETETFGNVTLEAMASGLAIVACDHAAAHAHLRHGESALLAPRGAHAEFIDHAVRLARDPSLGRRLGAAAREASLALGWKQILTGLEDVLGQCMSQHAVIKRKASHAPA